MNKEPLFLNFEFCWRSLLFSFGDANA